MPTMENSKYRKLLASLKSDIENGKYGCGKPLPSVRALIRRHGLSNTTILHAIDELAHQGFVERRQGAGTFVSRRVHRKIGLIVPGVGYSEFYAEIAGAFSAIAQKNGYVLLLGDIKWSDSPDMVERTRACIATLIEHGVCGVLYQPLKFLRNREKFNRDILLPLRERNIPTVLLDTDFTARPCRSDYDIVSLDNIGAGAIVAAHMLERGARNICFHMRRYRLPSVLDRYRGVVLHKLESPLSMKRRDDLLVCEPDNHASILRFMRTRPVPDAFVCENDADAAEFIKSLNVIGYAVPDDVMVAGFDDVRIAELLNPSLTSIHQPCEKIAESAFHRLVERLANPDLAGTAILLPPSLKVRESTNKIINKGKRKRNEHESL